MTKEEQKLYSRGYNAGRKRTDAEFQKSMKIHDEIYSKEKEIYRSYFNSALSGILASVGSSNWSSGEKRIKNIPGYTQLAKDFADEAKKILR